MAGRKCNLKYIDFINAMKRFGSNEHDICIHGVGVEPELICDNVVIAPWWEPSSLPALGWNRRKFEKGDYFAGKIPMGYRRENDEWIVPPKYLLGNLLVCGDCSASYRRRTERGKVVWRCATRIKKAKRHAHTPRLWMKDGYRILWVKQFVKMEFMMKA